MAEAYPLEWPAGWPRTKYPGPSAFKVSQEQAWREMVQEVDRLGGTYLVVSSNLRTRLDGGWLSKQRVPDDKGVAVYFQHKGKQKVFACDSFDTVGDNVRAIGMTIEAIRGMKRWGASDLLERTMSAFDALPPPSDGNAPLWPTVLGISPDASVETIEAAFRSKAKESHPDMHGGSDVAFKALSAARDAAIQARAQPVYGAGE